MAVAVEGERRTGMSWKVTVFAVVAVLCSVEEASAFNVDMDNIVQYTGRFAESMFGFSVALMKDSRESWVLVGAPEAQSLRQRGVARGGAVYRCPISRGANCEEVPFDQSDGNNRNATNHDLDNKSYQWFGATISAAASGAAVVACAPRYVYYPHSREQRHDPVGTCWVAKDGFQTFDEYSPCRTSEWGYHRKGHCQAGLGASISKDGRQLFIGAPGSHYWQGLLFSVDATVFMPFLPPESIRVNISSGQLFVENLYRRSEVRQTLEGPSSEDDTYLGYSVTVGEFDGKGNTTVAVGRPRGSQLTGKVEIYSSTLEQVFDIIGDQLGSYFGYSLCASDMDGDGLDDLIVGAPLYTERNNEKKYETGRVYVFYQNGDYEKNDTKDGINSRSRFGLSVSSLGDINKDGYGDLAVGAPYDHYESKAKGFGQGAVYIYLGSKTGIREKPSQIIYAKDVAPSLSTFGFSVSGGQDLDNNEYPDLVIGAYEANVAAFFRSRPIVKVDATVGFNISSKQINLKNYNCRIDGEQTICSSVRTCLQFSGVGVENWHDFEVQVILDSITPRTPRLFFRESKPVSFRNITFRASRGVPYCRDFDVYVKPNIRDKLTPLEAEMRYRLIEVKSGGRYPRLAPVLDLTLPPVKKDSLNIIKNCGPDNICIPDLKMKATPSVHNYLLGTGEAFNITVEVTNYGEDAFESTFNLQLPKGLYYNNIRRLDNNKEITVQCSPPSLASNNTLLCDIGNPLPSKNVVAFKVIMHSYYAEGLRSRYVFNMHVNSTNPEKPGTRKDNHKTLEIPIGIQTELDLSGGSKPSDVFWNSSKYTKNEGFTEESEIGPLVIHEHRILNEGPADIVEAKVLLVVPTSTFGGDNLLYILDNPETHGPIICEKLPEFNYLNLKLDSKRSDERGASGYVDQYVSRDSSSSRSSSSSSSSSSSGGSYAHEGGRGVSSTHNRGRINKIVGTDEDRVMRKEEDSQQGSLGQSGSGYGHQSSHNFENKSQSSWRVETTHGGSGPVVHSSSNFSASWSENGGPVHHYENRTSGSEGQISSGAAHHNGRGHESGSSQHFSSSGRREGRVEEHGFSRTHQSETSQTGRGFSESAGGHQGSSKVHHSSSTNTNNNYDEDEEEEYDDLYEEEEEEEEDNRRTGGGYYSSTGGSRDNVGGSRDNVGGSRDNVGGSRDNVGGSRDNVGGSRDNVGGSRDNVGGSRDNVGGSRDNVGGSRDNVGGSRDNVRVSHTSSGSSHDAAGGSHGSTHRTNSGSSFSTSWGSHGNAEGSRDDVRGSQDNAGGYRESSGRYHGSSGTHDDSDRRQGHNSSRGTFQHLSSWSEDRGNRQESSGGQWSSGRDNVDEDRRRVYSGSDSVGRDNVDEDRRQEGAYGHTSHQSTARTHGGSVSHHVSPSADFQNYSTSSWSYSGSSQSQHQNSRQGNHGGDASVRQYLSNNWNSEQSQAGGDRHDSRAGSRRGQGGNTYEGQGWEESRTGEGRGGTGHFYTSVLFENGNTDLGYAARGYGEPRDSLSSLGSRQRTASTPRTTTLDPDLSDLGSRFNDDAENEEYNYNRDQDSDKKLKLYNRYRRSAPNRLEEIITCNATNCTKIYCTLGPLKKSEEVRINLRMRAWVPTLKKFKDDRTIKTSTKMALQITQLPYIGTPHDEIIRDQEVFTNLVSTDAPTVPDIVPLWVVVLSAVAGTVILLLLIFLLYKCGFFKRNRPSDSAEKEPLNRNGHYNTGDEAL